MTNVTQLHPSAPKLSEGEASALQHDSYLAQIRRNDCAHCGCGEKWIELYEVWTHPIKTHASRFTQLRPTARILAGFDLAFLEIPCTTVPVCSECIIDYKVEGARDSIPAASRSAWAETLVRKYAPAPTAKTGRPEPSLDSL